MRYHFLIFFLFITQYLFCEEMPVPKKIKTQEFNTAIIDLEGFPSAFVGNAVNVITGNYSESETDIFIPGPNPVILERSFNSANKSKGTITYGWDFNQHGRIEYGVDEDRNRKTAILIDRGAVMSFKGKLSKKELHLEPKCYEKGVTNCSRGKISAKSNISLRKLNVKKEKQFILNTEKGEELFFKRKKITKKESLRYLITKATLPNGGWKEYSHSGKNISRINFKTKGGSTGSLNFIYNKYNWRVSVGACQTTNYQFQKITSKRKTLKKVIRDHAPDITYNYALYPKTTEKLVKRLLPDNRFLAIRYYRKGNNTLGDTKISITKKDPAINRVSMLSAPVGADGTAHPIYKFIYHVNRFSLSGKTDVFDALGYKTRYSFGPKQRLTSISYFNTDESLYRKEQVRFANMLMISRSLENDCGETVLHRSLNYDSRGNVIKDSLYGNLSGNCFEKPFILEKRRKKINLNCECYSKSYTYSLRNQLISEDDGRKKITYTYTRDKIKTKFVYEGDVIRERHFFDYDASGALILEIVDNGSSKNKDEIAGVTERKIRKITNTKSPLGLPEKIEEWYLDVNSGQEVLLNTTVNSYIFPGYLVEEKKFDSENNLYAVKSYQYNTHGKVIEEIDPLGQVTTYDYDENDNCIKKQTPRQSYTTFYEYDNSNRLVKEIEEHKDGKTLVKSYAYDLKGNKISSIDIYNNEILYEYDPFDRLVKKISPSIVNLDGELIETIDEVAYDILNNPIEKKDAKGLSHFTYTVLGKPCQIVNPDGSVVTNHYDTDGQLLVSVDTEGVEKRYDYDYLKRKIKEEIYGADGSYICCRKWIYDAFHLLEEIDPEGISTCYSYDGAGRLASTIKLDTERKYIYDDFNRIVQIWDLYEEGRYKKTLIKYDVLNRVVEEKITDHDGTLLSCKTYDYDSDGNCICESTKTDNGVSFVYTEYNAHKQPLHIINADGHTTYFHYRYDYINKFGQNVPYEEEVDPRGTKIIRIKDAQGHLAEERIENPLSETIKRTAYQFDEVGNIVRRIEDKIISSECIKSIITGFSYDVMNNEIKVIEALNEDNQKITHREYTTRGELAKLIKPDGVVINHVYDSLNRLIEKISSDGTINEIYTYNLNDKITSVFDKINNHKTERVFDGTGRLLEEKLGNGLCLVYEYDSLGRTTLMTLPDGTSVSYEYNADQLININRHTKSQSYNQRYQYDLSGCIKTLTLPFDNGDVNYDCDSALRPISITSDYMAQKLSYDNCGNLQSFQGSDNLGSSDLAFGYDDLHQLISEKGTSNNDYDYDSLYNRTKKNNQECVTNSLNQLVSQGDTHYIYDLNGNLIQKKNDNQLTQYTYDALNRLMSVTTNTNKVTYQYDAFNRRIKKTSDVNHRYIYQADCEIGVMDKDSHMLEFRLVGLGKGDVGSTVSIEINGNVYLTLNDYRGSIATIVDPKTKYIAETYRYTAYGELDLEKSLSPWGFSGKRFDSESGFWFFGHRYYDPDTGRWTTTDPLWFEDGTNLYAFVKNNPLKRIDPDGLLAKYLFGLHREIISSFSTGTLQYEKICNEDAYGKDAQINGSWSSLSVIDGIKHDSIMFTCMNGINTHKNHAIEQAQYISKLSGGYEVTLVHNSSHGFLKDGTEYLLNRLGFETEPVKMLRETWENYLDNNPSGVIIHTAQSHGTAITHLALQGMDEEKRNRVHVLGIAPAKYIPKEIARSSEHLISKNDQVWLADFSNFYKNAENVTFLDPYDGAPILFDHSFMSPTLERDLEIRYLKLISRENEAF